MTIQHKMILTEAKDYLFIVLGLLIYTIAFTVFLMPYQIVAGGVTGLSAIIYYATGFHLENTYIIINGVLLVVALKILGVKFLMKTIFAIFTLYFMLMFAQEILPKQENGMPFKLMGEGQAMSLSLQTSVSSAPVCSSLSSELIWSVPIR